MSHIHSGFFYRDRHFGNSSCAIVLAYGMYTCSSMDWWTQLQYEICVSILRQYKYRNRSRSIIFSFRRSTRLSGRCKGNGNRLCNSKKNSPKNALQPFHKLLSIMMTTMMMTMMIICHSHTSAVRAHANRPAAVEHKNRRRLLGDECRVIAVDRVQHAELLVNSMHRRRRRFSLRFCGTAAAVSVPFHHRRNEISVASVDIAK